MITAFIAINAVLGFALLGVVLALLVHANLTERSHRPLQDQFTAIRAQRRARHTRQRARARQAWSQSAAGDLG